jgi:hypothetical protein
MEQQANSTGVGLDMPIVKFLMETLSEEKIRYTHEGEEFVATVPEAFAQCGALVEMGQRDPKALVSRIQEAVNQERIRRAEAGEL